MDVEGVRVPWSGDMDAVIVADMLTEFFVRIDLIDSVPIKRAGPRRSGVERWHKRS